MPIQPSEILSYARIFGFMGDIEFFYRCVCEMDMEFFKYESQKRKNEEKAPKKPAAKGPRPLKRR